MLAVDKNQLRSSVQTLYGHELNFDEYYRKFAHRNITLPLISEKSAPNLIKHYWDEVISHIEHRPKTHSYARYDETTAANLQEAAVCLKLSPRQIHEMCRIYGHVMTLKKEKSGDLFWGFRVAAALMCGLSVGAPKLYEAIGAKRATFQDIWKVLQELLAHKEHGEWWIGMMGNGRAFSISSFDETLAQVKGVGLLPKLQAGDHFRSFLAQHSEAWGHWHGEHPFSYVYSIIEKLRRFENAASAQ